MVVLCLSVEAPAAVFSAGWVVEGDLLVEIALGLNSLQKSTRQGQRGILHLHQSHHRPCFGMLLKDSLFYAGQTEVTYKVIRISFIVRRYATPRP